jgi:xanthine dehydrogenase YagS FAD-binding subunit
MQAFAYVHPENLKDALASLSPNWGETDVLAGGTDLLALMKDQIHTPKTVVSLKGVKELKGIKSTAAGLEIGAMTTVDEMMSNAAVRAYPALVQAAAGIASPQIRNMGTVGGDLCQRPRCWYFRQGFGLLAQKDGKSLVENGENRYHAIFGSGPARFVSASSFAPALVALGAKVKIASAAGEREVAVADFFVAPSAEGQRENVLKPNEIVTAIVVPAAAGKRSATYEVRQKEALDWPLAAASVVLTMKGTAVAKAEIVMGHVGPVPVAAESAAAMLAGKTITAETAEAAGAEAVKAARPLKGNEYKVQLAKVAVKRALLTAAGIKV